MSQQPNENVPKQSQPQQTGSEADLMHKPFSMRKYVLACRKKNIHNNWPFGEKYLQLCLKLGMKEVLPPMVLNKTVHLQNDDNNNKQDDSRQDLVPDHPQSNENNCDNKVTSHCSSNEVENQHNSITFSDLFSSSKAVEKNKRGRRKGGVRKRYIADILSVARCSTQEEIQSMNQYTYADLPADEESCTGAGAASEDDDVV